MSRYLKVAGSPVHVEGTEQRGWETPWVEKEASLQIMELDPSGQEVSSGGVGQCIFVIYIWGCNTPQRCPTPTSQPCLGEGMEIEHQQHYPAVFMSEDQTVDTTAANETLPGMNTSYVYYLNSEAMCYNIS